MHVHWAYIDIPADTRRLINVGITLVHRLRRSTNVKPTLTQRIVSAGIYMSVGRFFVTQPTSSLK